MKLKSKGKMKEPVYLYSLLLYICRLNSVRLILKMASKLSAVLFLVVIAQICTSYRITRTTELETQKDQTFPSYGENLDEIKANFTALLNETQKAEFEGIFDKSHKAQTLEEKLDAMMKMILFGIKIGTPPDGSTTAPHTIPDNKF